MTRLILTVCLLAACAAGAARADGLNDRTKKLLQTQALNRPQQQSTTRNPNTAADDDARNGARNSNAGSQPPSPSPSPSRGAAGNMPQQKP